MKIKHWAGYGFVTAKKVSKTTLFDDRRWCDVTELVIDVVGCHEQWLAREDTYDVYNWLVKKFDKSVTDYRDMLSVECDEDALRDGCGNVVKEDGYPVHKCRFTIIYKKQ